MKAMKHSNQYALRIIKSAPDKITLVRLAEYMLELGKLLGESDRVHFSGLVKGSAVVRAWAEESAAESVSRRVQLCRTGNAPQDAGAAMARINQMLGEDGTNGELKDPAGAVVIPFPGVKVLPDTDLLVTEEGHIDGQVIKIGGRDDTIPLWLRDADGVEYRCTIRGGELAKAISAHYLGDPIRIYGRGKWRRNHDGEWTLDNMIVSSFQELSSDWDSAFQLMHSAAAGWADTDIEAECDRLRKGC